LEEDEHGPFNSIQQFLLSFQRMFYIELHIVLKIVVIQIAIIKGIFRGKKYYINMIILV